MKVIKYATHPTYISPNSKVTYSRNDKPDYVVINNDQSLKIAIEYTSEDAYDIRKGIAIFITLYYALIKTNISLLLFSYSKVCNRLPLHLINLVQVAFQN